MGNSPGQLKRPQNCDAPCNPMQRWAMPGLRNNRVVNQPRVPCPRRDRQKRGAGDLECGFKCHRIDSCDVVDQQVLLQENFLNGGQEAVGLAVAGFALLLGEAQAAAEGKGALATLW